MELDIKTAASTFNVSRPTIYKKIKSGELSRLSNGKIDFSEMLRVFGEPSSRVDMAKSVKTDTKRQDLDALHDQESALLREKIRLLEDSLRDAKSEKEWLRSKVDELTSTVKLLQAPPAQAPARQQEERHEKKGFLARVLGF